MEFSRKNLNNKIKILLDELKICPEYIVVLPSKNPEINFVMEDKIIVNKLNNPYTSTEIKNLSKFNVERKITIMPSYPSELPKKITYIFKNKIYEIDNSSELYNFIETIYNKKIICNTVFIKFNMDINSLKLFPIFCESNEHYILVKKYNSKEPELIDYNSYGVKTDIILQLRLETFEL